MSRRSRRPPPGPLEYLRRWPLQAWLAWVFPAMSVLCVITIMRRVREGLNENNGGAAK